MFSAYRILLFLPSRPILLRESKRYPFLAAVQILPLSFMAYLRAQFLVPFCFLLYRQPLSQIIDRHSVFHVEFADDSQLCNSVPREQLDFLLCNMQSCVDDVKLWMTQNKLQLNEGKTEVLLIDPQNSPNLPL